MIKAYDEYQGLWKSFQHQMIVAASASKSKVIEIRAIPFVADGGLVDPAGAIEEPGVEPGTGVDVGVLVGSWIRPQGGCVP
jgi:hypothetical protein